MSTSVSSVPPVASSPKPKPKVPARPSVDKEDPPKAKPKVPVRPKPEAVGKDDDKEKERKKADNENTPADSEKLKNEVKEIEATTEEVEAGEGENGEKPAEAEEGSRWRKLYNKTAFTFQSSKDSAAAAAAAKKEAAAQKLKATQEQTGPLQVQDQVRVHLSVLIHNLFFKLLTSFLATLGKKCIFKDTLIFFLLCLTHSIMP